MRYMRMVVPLVLLVASSCLRSPAGPQLIGEGRRALFVGNSYLYSLDIPGVVQALADSAGGDQIAVETVAFPDFALIDHWHEGTARSEIAEGGWEWVVLQQGPSSVEANRDSLRRWTQLFAGIIEDGRPALFSAWPSEPRRQDFDRAIESYTLAAADVDGILLPVAAAWLAAWRRDPALRLYADGLHPSPEGAYLSALVIYGRLLAKSPVGLPRGIRTRGGLTVLVSPENAAVLQAAAAEALDAP